MPLPDLTHRTPPNQLPEWMDGPCSYATFRDTVQEIASTTRLTQAYRPTLRFLASAHRAAPGRPLHIVDVGFGGGDVLREIARWAFRHRVPVRLTGIDLNPHAAPAARELSSHRSLFRSIEWRTGNAFTDPATQSPDLVLSSLVTHHMEDGEIVRFLRWMEAHARLGWFLSDLVRSRRSYQLYGPLSRLLRWHPYVQHDGLVSIRRAFREEDWERLLAGAGLAAPPVRLYRCGIGRLCLARLVSLPPSA